MGKVGFTDIHTHILPGVDDGPETRAEAFEILRLAWDAGIRRIITTPHYGHKCHSDPAGNKTSFDGFVADAAVEWPDMEFFRGNEIYIDSGTVAALDEGRAMTLAGSRYALVEFDYGATYDVIYGGLREILEGGYRPVLAHVEVYGSLARGDRAEELNKLGVYLQVDTGNMAGGRFDPVAQRSREMFREGLIDFLATDCHDTEKRKPDFRRALNKLKGVDEKLLNRVLYENTEKLLHDEII